MTSVTAHQTISLDGFAAGPDQSQENPIGVGGVAMLDDWMFNSGDENAAETESIVAPKAYIMGRNMFSPVAAMGPRLAGLVGRGPAVPRPGVRAHPLRARRPADGGRHHVPLRHRRHRGRARPGARGGRRRRGRRSPAAPRPCSQYLAAGLIDELHVHLVPVMLGGGERLFDDLPGLTLEPVSARHHPKVTHVTYRRRS